MNIFITIISFPYLCFVDLLNYSCSSLNFLNSPLTQRYFFKAAVLKKGSKALLYYAYKNITLEMTDIFI